jgi:hypothetical protein
LALDSLDARGLESWKKTILDGKLPNERRAPPIHESGAKVDECFYIRYCFINDVHGKGEYETKKKL